MQLIRPTASCTELVVSAWKAFLAEMYVCKSALNVDRLCV